MWGDGQEARHRAEQAGLAEGWRWGGQRQACGQKATFLSGPGAPGELGAGEGQVLSFRGCSDQEEAEELLRGVGGSV